MTALSSLPIGERPASANVTCWPDRLRWPRRDSDRLVSLERKQAISFACRRPNQWPRRRSMAAERRRFVVIVSFFGGCVLRFSRRNFCANFSNSKRTQPARHPPVLPITQFGYLQTSLTNQRADLCVWWPNSIAIVQPQSRVCVCVISAAR